MERPREGRRREKEERETREIVPPKVPASSGSDMTKGKGKGKAPPKKKPMRKSIPTGSDRPSRSQRAAPGMVRAQRWALARPQRESGTEGPLQIRDRSRSR